MGDGFKIPLSDWYNQGRDWYADQSVGDLAKYGLRYISPDLPIVGRIPNPATAPWLGTAVNIGEESINLARKIPEVGASMLNRTGFSVDTPEGSFLPNISIGSQGLGRGMTKPPPVEPLVSHRRRDSLSPSPAPPSEAPPPVYDFSGLFPEGQGLGEAQIDPGGPPVPELQGSFEDVLGGRSAAQPQPQPQGQETVSGSGGPSAWDKIQGILTDPRTARLASEVWRQGQRPDSSRPYAQMGFDQQTSEIQAKEAAQQELMAKMYESQMNQDLKRQEIQGRESLGREEISSRERIAQMDRDAQDARIKAQYGTPIDAAMAQSMGLSPEWVGHSVEEAKMWQDSVVMKQMRESEAIQGLLTQISTNQKDAAVNRRMLLDILIKNQSTLMLMSPEEQQQYHDLFRAEGLPVPQLQPQIPPQMAGEGQKGFLQKLKEFFGFGGGGGGAETVSPAPAGPLTGLSREDAEAVAGIQLKHKGDQATINQLLREFAESSNKYGAKDPRRMEIIGRYLTEGANR